MLVVEKLKQMGACSPSVEWSRQFGDNYRLFYESIPRGDWKLWYLVSIDSPKQFIANALLECTRYIVEIAGICDCKPLNESMLNIEKWCGAEKSLDELRADMLNITNCIAKQDADTPILFHLFVAVYYTLEYITKGTSPIDVLDELYDAATCVKFDKNRSGGRKSSILINTLPEYMAGIINTVVPWKQIKHRAQN